MSAYFTLALHIATGTVALGSAAAALIYRKGSRSHRLAGRAFVVAMLLMAGSGAYIAYSMRVTLSVIGGLLTLYLVATAWVTVTRKTQPPGIVEAVGLLVALLIGGIAMASGFEAANSETGLKDGFHPGQYFMFGALALLAAAGDLRLLVAGGITGPKRIARHLWRMCTALTIAAAAFFLGQARLFPEVVRESNLLLVPVLLSLLVMLYWLYRVLISRRNRPAP